MISPGVSFWPGSRGRRSPAGNDDGDQGMALASEDRLKIAPVALVVRVSVHKASRLGSMPQRGISVKFDGGLSSEEEENVPKEQNRDGDADREGEDEGEHDGRSRFLVSRSSRRRHALTSAGRGPGHGAKWFGGDVDAVNARREYPEQKDDKVAIVGESDDVEHPRTVVIHVQDEFARDVVVVRSRSLGSLAVLAISPLKRIPVDPRRVATTRPRPSDGWRFESVHVAVFLELELRNFALGTSLEDELFVDRRRLRSRVRRDAREVVEEDVECEVADPHGVHRPLEI